MSRPPDLTDGRPTGVPQSESSHQAPRPQAPVLTQEPRLRGTPQAGGRTLVAEQVPAPREEERIALRTAVRIGVVPSPATLETPIPVPPASPSDGERREAEAPPDGTPPVAFQPDTAGYAPTEQAVKPEISVPDNNSREASSSRSAPDTPAVARVPVDIMTMPMRFVTDTDAEDLTLPEHDTREISQAPVGGALFARANTVTDPASRDREAATPQPDGTTRGAPQEAIAVHEQGPEIVFLGQDQEILREERSTAESIVRAHTDADEPHQEPQEPATSQAAQPQRTSAQEEPDQPPTTENTGNGARDGNDRPPADPGEAGRNGPDDNGEQSEHPRERREGHREIPADDQQRGENEEGGAESELPPIPIRVRTFITDREPEVEKGKPPHEQINRLLEEGFTDTAIAKALELSLSTIHQRRITLIRTRDIPIKGKMMDELARLLQLGRYADEQIARGLGVSRGSIEDYRKRLRARGIDPPRISIRQAVLSASEPEVADTPEAGPRVIGIAVEQREAGTLINQLLLDNNKSAADLAEKLGVDEDTVTQFIQGRGELNLEAVYREAVATGIDPERDQNRDRMTRINALKRQQNWFRTLGPEGVPLAEGLNSLRLEKGETQRRMATRLGLSDGYQLTSYLSGERTFRAEKLSRLLRSYGIKRYGKVWQLFHAKRAGIEIKPIDEFTADLPGEQLRHIREALGLTLPMLERSLKKLAALEGYQDYQMSRYAVRRMEVGAPISDETITLLSRLLGFPATSSQEREPALIRTMRRRAAGLPARLTDEDYAEIIDGPLLVKENIEQASRTAEVDDAYDQINRPPIPVRVRTFTTDREPEVEAGQPRAAQIDRLLREGFTDTAISKALEALVPVVNRRRMDLARTEDIPVKGKIMAELARLLELRRYADEQLINSLGVSRESIINYRKRLKAQGIDIPRITIRQALLLASEPEIADTPEAPRVIGVAVEQRKAGALINELLRDNNKSAADLAEKLGVDEDTVIQFMQGREELDLEAVYREAVAAGIDPRTTRNRDRMTRINALKRQQNWFRTLGPEAVLLAEGLDSLRLEQGETQSQMARRLRLSSGSQLSIYLAGEKTFQAENLSRLLQEYDIDLYSKVWQLFHAKRAGIEIKPIDEFAADLPGEQLKHIREVFGLTQTMLVNTLESLAVQEGYQEYQMSQFKVHSMEAGATISDETITLLSRLLGFPATSSQEREPALVRTMRRRAAGLPARLTDEDYAEIIDGPLLVKENIEQASRTAEVDDAYDQINRHDQLYAVVTELMTAKGITDINELNTDDGIKSLIRDMLGNMRLQGTIPYNENLLRLLLSVDPTYTIHSPTVQYALGVARAERNRHAENR